jgi:DNA-binding transcriptional ArsR family regulator
VDTNHDAGRWGALGDGTRLAIVARLAERPQAVGQLAAGLPVSRSAVSQHLKILKDAGLVEDAADGTRRIYRLNPVALAALRDQLDTYWQHRHIDRHGPGWEAITGGVDGPEGWPLYLDRYAALVKEAS